MGGEKKEEVYQLACKSVALNRRHPRFEQTLPKNSKKILSTSALYSAGISFASVVDALLPLFCRDPVADPGSSTRGLLFFPCIPDGGE
jgi:hypothetical protein